MKATLSLALLALSFGAQIQAASIECSKASVSTGGSMEEFWSECQADLYYGDVCFRGPRKEVIELLAELDSEDILGDEYRIINTWYVGKYEIKFDVYDGPNGRIASQNRISSCE